MSPQKAPQREKLVMKPNGMVVRQVTKIGRFNKEYTREGVQLGPIEEIEKKRPELLPKIHNYVKPAERGIVDDPFKNGTPEDLARSLRKIDSQSIVKEMMERDDRPWAERVYIDRLQQLEDGEEPEEPEEPESEPDPDPDPNDGKPEVVEGEGNLTPPTTTEELEKE